MQKTLLAALAGVLVGATTIPAEEAMPSPPALNKASQEAINAGWGLFVEQDSVFSPGTDKDYTMGVQFSWTGWRVRRNPVIANALAKPLNWLDQVSLAKRLHDRVCKERNLDLTAPPDCVGSPTQTAVQSHSFVFGTTAFTPRKGDPLEEGPGCPARGCILHRSDIVFNDRPYASLSYFTLRRTTTRGRTSTSSDFTLGVLGLQVAKVVQSAIHDDITDPGGWRHQISNGGEPTAAYRVGVKQLLFARTRGPRNDWAVANPTDREDDHFVDLTVDMTGSAGLYTYAGGGLRARIGLIDSPFWAADRQTIEFVKAPGQVRAARPPFLQELFVWGSVGEQIWAHNSLLQGQFRHSDTTLKFDPAPDDPNFNSPLHRSVWEFQAGALLRLRPMVVAYQYARYSALFAGPHTRPHAYWSIQLSFPTNQF